MICRKCGIEFQPSNFDSTKLYCPRCRDFVKLLKMNLRKKVETQLKLGTTDFDSHLIKKNGEPDYDAEHKAIIMEMNNLGLKHGHSKATKKKRL